MCRDLRVHISRDVTDVMLNVELCWCAQGKISSSTVLSNLYAMGVTECDNMLMHVGVSQKMSDKERDAVLPLLATGFKVPELNQLVITCLHHQYHEQNRLVGTREGSDGSRTKGQSDKRPTDRRPTDKRPLIIATHPFHTTVAFSVTAIIFLSRTRIISTYVFGNVLGSNNSA